MKPFLPSIYDMDYDKFNANHMPMPDPELLDAFVRDMKNHESGNLVPETSGADYFFIRYFITEDMRWDFDRIEEDFVKHCYDKFRDFAKVQWYEQNSIRFSSPEESHCYMVMGLILNGAKAEDEYCKALIRYLFKTYHKSLYKQLKRFSKISADEVISLSEIDGQMDLGNMAVILTMCSIDNVVLGNSCAVLYDHMEKIRQEYEAEDEEDTQFMEFSDELFEECREQVDRWVEEDEKAHPSFGRQLKTYWKEDEYIAGCLKHLGYPGDYLYRCMQNHLGLSIQFTRTLAVLRTVYPKREFSFEEVQKYAHLYSAISALIDVSEELEKVNREMLGLETDYATWEEETFFHPENIVIHKSEAPKKETHVLTKVARVETDTITKEDYLAEIDALRSKLSQRETEYKKLKMQYAASNSARKEAEALLSKYQNDREELIALREFVYHLEQEAPEIEAQSLDEMKEAIATKKYVIVGGHVNWVNKLKAEFPGWTYILPSTFKTVDAGVLDHKDMIFFFTDHISHAAYGKFIGIARERKIPFSYLHGVNMEQIIRQIYESGK